MFDIVFNSEATLERSTGDENKFGEVVYEEPIVIKCAKFGTSNYDRDLEDSTTYVDMVYQTLEDIKVGDKIDGNIVKKVTKHYDIFGKFRYVEAYVSL